MNKFTWYEAQSIEDAIGEVNTTVSEELYEASGKAAIFKSGGVDLLDLMKEGLINASKIVNIRNIPGLDKIQMDKESGFRLGANVTLSDIEHNEEIRDQFPALYQAIYHAATPQLRNMATLGGNLAQRTRCWYFRSADHDCFRKGGDRCFARHSETGANENHAIIDNGSCVSVHASSISTVLIAYQAKVVIVNAKNERKEVALENFFVAPAQDISRECILEPGDMITEVILPIPSRNTRGYYIKSGTRESYDWSTADVAVVAEFSGNTCDKAIVVLGAAAPTPIRSYEAEKVLVGKALNEETAKMAAKAAMSNARPLSRNAYKIPLFESIIKRAIMEIS